MKRIELLLIFIFLAVAVLLFFSLRYFDHPPSLMECFRISDSYYKHECITAVAAIKSDSSICDFMSEPTFSFTQSPREECKDAVAEWRGYDITPQLEDQEPHSGYTLEECAKEGLVRLAYRVEFPFYNDEIVISYAFAPGCEQLLQEQNESYCYREEISSAGEYKRNYTEECVTSMRIAKGFGAEYACEEASSIYPCYSKYASVTHDKSVFGTERGFESYYADFAIINNDKSACSLANGYNTSCLFYFALKENDEVLCDGMANEYVPHLCKAVILAQKEEESGQ